MKLISGAATLYACTLHASFVICQNRAEDNTEAQKARKQDQEWLSWPESMVLACFGCQDPTWNLAALICRPEVAETESRKFNIPTPVNLGSYTRIFQTGANPLNLEKFWTLHAKFCHERPSQGSAVLRGFTP